ncbi:MAG: hypothetical protein AB1568_16590 [Thermodesulfobacteriota bacterium]
MKPSTVWDRMRKLEKLQNIDIQTNSHYSVISVVNWNSYQGENSESDRQTDNKPTGNRQPADTNKKSEKEGEASPGKSAGLEPSVDDLRHRYSDQTLLDRVIAAIASTRKGGKVSPSIVSAQFKSWERFPVAQVEEGMRTYIERGYAAEGKDEKYLLGIIRGCGRREAAAGSSAAGGDWWEGSTTI